MSYMRIGNYRIRKNGKKVSLFDTVNTIKQFIKGNFPEIDETGMLKMMSHCRGFYEGKLQYGRRGSNYCKPRLLTQIEKALYDYLIKEGHNPSTSYRWFLACRMPSDILTALKEGRISQKRAFKLSSNRIKNRQSAEGLELLELIRNKVRGF
jgi:hypothetical protein